MTLEARLAPPPLPTGRCAECGAVRALADLVPIGNCPVCSDCKPAALRKLTTGLPVGTMWRNGKELVVTRATPFPDRCVKCNGSVETKRLVRNLTWHHPLIYILVLLSP